MPDRAFPEFPEVFTEEERSQLEQLQAQQQQMQELWHSHFADEAWGQKPAIERGVRHALQPLADFIPRIGRAVPPFTRDAAIDRRIDIEERIKELDKLMYAQERAPEILNELYTLAMMGDPVLTDDRVRAMYKELDNFPDEWTSYIMQYAAAVSKATPEQLRDGTFWDASAPGTMVDYMDYFRTTPGLQTLSANQILSSVAFSQDTEEIRQALRSAYPPAEGTEITAEQYTQQTLGRYAQEFAEYGLIFDPNNPEQSFEELATHLLHTEGVHAHLYNEDTGEYIMVRKTPALPQFDMPYPAIWYTDPDTGEQEFLGFYNEEDNTFAPWDLATGHPYLSDLDMELADRHWIKNFGALLARTPLGVVLGVGRFLLTDLPASILMNVRAFGHHLTVGQPPPSMRLTKAQEAELDERMAAATRLSEELTEEERDAWLMERYGRTDLSPLEMQRANLERLAEMSAEERAKVFPDESEMSWEERRNRQLERAWLEDMNKYEDWWDRWHPKVSADLGRLSMRIQSWWNKEIRTNPAFWTPPEHDVSLGTRLEQGENFWEIIGDVPWTMHRVVSGVASVGTFVAINALALKTTKKPAVAFGTSALMIGAAESTDVYNVMVYELGMDYDEVAVWMTALTPVLGVMQQGGHLFGSMRVMFPGMYSRITGRIVKDTVREHWSHYGRDYIKAVAQTQFIETVTEMSVQMTKNVVLYELDAIEDWKQGAGDMLFDISLSFLAPSLIGGGRYMLYTQSHLTQEQANWINREAQMLLEQGYQADHAKEEAYKRFFSSEEGQQVFKEKVMPEAVAAIEAERRAPDVVRESHHLEDMIQMQDRVISETKEAIKAQQDTVELAERRRDSPRIKRLQTKHLRQVDVDRETGLLNQMKETLAEAEQKKAEFENKLRGVTMQVQSQGLMTKQLWDSLYEPADRETRRLYLNKIGYRGHEVSDLIGKQWFELPMQVQVALEGDITPLAYTGHPNEVAGIEQAPQLEHEAANYRISAINDMLAEKRGEVEVLRNERDKAAPQRAAEFSDQINQLNSEIKTLMEDRTQAQVSWDTSNEAMWETHTVNPLSTQAIQHTANTVEQVHNAEATKHDVDPKVDVGSTVHPVHGNLAGQPYYSVSPYTAGHYRSAQIIPGKTVTAEQIADFIMHNMHLLQNADHSVGTWYVADRNHVVLDIVVTPESLHRALDIAEVGRQEAIFDLQTFETIQVAIKDAKTGDLTPILYKQPWTLRHYSAREGSNAIKVEHFGEGASGTEKQFYEIYRPYFDAGDFVRRSYWVVDKKGDGTYEGMEPWMTPLGYNDTVQNFRIYDKATATEADNNRVDARYNEIVEQYKERFGKFFEGLPQNQAEMLYKAVHDAGYEGMYVPDRGVAIFKDVTVRPETQIEAETHDYTVTIDGESYSIANPETQTGLPYETTNVMEYETVTGDVVGEVLVEGIEMPAEVQSRFLSDARRELETARDTGIKNLFRAPIADGEMLIRVDSQGEVAGMATILMREGTPTLSVVVADQAKPGGTRALALRDILKYAQDNNVAAPPTIEMSPQAIRIYQKLNRQVPLVKDMLERQKWIKERLATKRIPLEERRTLELEFRHHAAVLEVINMETAHEAGTAIHSLRQEIGLIENELGYRRLPYHWGKKNPHFPGWSTAQLEVTARVYRDALDSGIFGDTPYTDVQETSMQIGWANEAYASWETINFSEDASTTNQDVGHTGLPPMDNSPIIENFQHDPDLKLARLPSMQAETAAISMAVNAKGNEAIAKFIGDPADLSAIPNNSVSWKAVTTPAKKGLSVENWQYILGNMQAKFGLPFHRMFKRFRQADGYGNQVKKDFHQMLNSDADLVQAFQTEEGMNRLRQIVNARGGWAEMPQNVTVSEDVASRIIEKWLQDWIPRVNIMAFERAVENLGLDANAIMNDLFVTEADTATMQKIVDFHRKGLFANRDALLAQQTHWMIKGFTPWITVRPDLGMARTRQASVRGEDRLAHRYGTEMPTELNFYQQLQLYNTQMSIQWALRGDLKAFEAMVNAVAPKVTQDTVGQMRSEMAQMINELQHLPATQHGFGKLLLRFYSTIAPAVYHTNPRLLLRNSLQAWVNNPHRLDWLLKGMRGIPVDMQQKSRMSYEFSTGQLQSIKTELDFHQYKPLWHRVPGYMTLHRLATRLNLYGHSDNIPRARSHHTGMAKAYRAIEAFKQHGNVRKLLRDSGMDLYTKEQQNRFLEMVAVRDGQWNMGANGLQTVTGYEAACLYAGESLADLVHYPYTRWIRPPVEQGIEGRWLANLMTFTREYWLRHVHHWQNALDSSLPMNTRLANFRANAGMVLMGVVISAWLRDIYGRHYRAYAPMDIMFFEVGGLMFGAARGLGELGSHIATMMDMSVDEAERERAWGKFVSSLRANAEINVPFLKNFLSSVEAGSGIEGIDRALLSRMREHLDKNYEADEIERMEISFLEGFRIAMFHAPFPDMDAFTEAQKELRERETEWLGTRDPVTGRPYTMSNYFRDVDRLVRKANLPADMITEEAGFSELTLYAMEFLRLLDEFQSLPTYPTSVRRDWRRQNPEFELMLIFWEQYQSTQVSPGVVVFTSDYVDSEVLRRLLGSTDGMAIVRAIESLDLYFRINPATMRSKFADFRTAVFRGD